MDIRVLQQLQLDSAAIHVRWEALLRIEPVSGPLANPDALARLIPESLAEIFTLLGASSAEGLSLGGMKVDRLPPCDCGHNPYLAYFVAAEQAFVEALILVQVKLPPDLHRESDIAQVIRAVRELARSEIDTFCGICTHRCVDPKCGIESSSYSLRSR
jgi:hypothetical protein